MVKVQQSSGRQRGLARLDVMSTQGRMRVLVAWSDQSQSISAEPGTVVTVGRAPDCSLVVPVPTVSRQHLRLSHVRGRWMVSDLGSTAGTRRQGTLLRINEPVPLIDGDTLDLGAGVLAAVEVESVDSGKPSTTGDDPTPLDRVEAVDKVSTDGLLAHVLTASRAIGQAADEDDIWANAVRALVEAEGLGVISAAVLELGPEGKVETRTSQGARTGGWSRRGLAAARETPGQTAIFERGGGGGGERATMMGDSQYVACHAPEVANVTGAIVVCAEGRASLGDRRANFTHFLGIVSEMAAQAVVQVRRSRIARYVSPSVASMLARGGQDALEQEPVWREAACVFLDLQGFSAAVDGDESALPEVHAQMQSLMDGLARAVFDEQGMVVDFTGDGLFAAFGVPAPREGHVASALRAAMAMRAVAPASRVGLDVGRCLFGPMGARQHAKLGLFGRVVNRASRMEALGRPERLGGGLLCTGAVVADPFAHRAADFLRLGRVQPAGLQEAVEVFEVVPPGSLDSTLLEALCLASVELEEARESGAFAALAARLEARSVDHVRFGWLAGHARRLVADPSGWDGVHRPGK